jgi:hypothetical protein
MNLWRNDMKTVDFRGQVFDASHGSPFDRGSADSYYHRPRDPHYYPEGTGHGERVTDLTDEQVKEYLAGYAHNERFGDKKSWV